MPLQVIQFHTRVLTYYFDDAGELQGPFPAAWIRAWVANGVLSRDKEVSSVPYGKGHKIGELDLLNNDYEADSLQRAQQLLRAEIERLEGGDAPDDDH